MNFFVRSFVVDLAWQYCAEVAYSFCFPTSMDFICMPTAFEKSYKHKYDGKEILITPRKINCIATIHSPPGPQSPEYFLAVMYSQSLCFVENDFEPITPNVCVAAKVDSPTYPHIN